MSISDILITVVVGVFVGWLLFEFCKFIYSEVKESSKFPFRWCGLFIGFFFLLQFPKGAVVLTDGGSIIMLTLAGLTALMWLIQRYR